MCPFPFWFLLLLHSTLPVYVGLVDKACLSFQVSAVVLDQMTVSLRFLLPAVLLTKCHCWKHHWKWVFGIACRTVSESSFFYIEGTAVWFLDLNSKPTFPVLLWPSRRSLALSNRRISLLVLVTKQPGHGLLAGSAACCSSTLDFADVFLHTRNLTCQQSPKWYVIGIRWRFLRPYSTFSSVRREDGRAGRSQYSTEFPQIWR